MKAIGFRAVGMRILAAASAVCLVVMIGCGDGKSGKKPEIPSKGSNGSPTGSPVDVQLPADLPGSSEGGTAQPKPEPKTEPKPEEKPAEPKPEEKPAEPKQEPKPEEKPASPSTGDSSQSMPAKSADIEIPEKHKISLEPTPTFLGKTVKPTPNPDAEASDEAGMKPYKETIPGAEVTFEMVPIKGGKYLRGSPDTEEGRKPDEGPQHEVEIEPFWMGKCEVTWEEYELWCLKLDIQRRKLKNQEPTENDRVADAIAMPTNPYTDMTFSMGKDGYPAICMTQLSAKMYCKWLSAKTGRYYRLPTEAEWEYACRAGTATAYSFGDDPSKLDDYAWYLDNSDDKYHKVGQKKPNPWGLHDMHGNVAEWVLDQYVADAYKQFAGKVTKNPFMPGTTEYNRVVRGGSWDDEPPALRSAARRSSEKIWKQQDPQIPQSVWYLTDATFVGFRVVRPLRTPTPEEAKMFELDNQQIEEFLDYDKAQAGKM